jgi:hypothetical protein
MLRIPNPIAYPCSNCGEPAVLVEFPTGLLPVHCGTYRETCPPPRPVQRRSPRRSPRRGCTVSDPPAGKSPFAAAKFRSLRRRLRTLGHRRFS